MLDLFSLIFRLKMSDNDEEFITDDLDNNEDITYEDILPEESASNITSSESSHSTARSSNRIQRGPKITSSVWPFFDKNTERHPGLPVCRTCQSVFKKTSSTTSLRQHLLSHHINAPHKRQKTLHEYRTDSHTERDQEVRDNAIIKWIICDQQPFTVVECKEWREMIQTFDQRYSFHNRKTTKQQILNLFEEKRMDIKKTIAQISGKVSLTSDMWTASNNDAFLSLTIHFVDNNWVLKNFLLDIIPFSIRHTGINMATAIMNVLQEFDLAEKTLALTTDNASSMIGCANYMAEELELDFNNFTFAHYRCAAHVLNLAVNQGMEFIDESILKVRSLMSYLRASSTTNAELKVLCDIKNIKYLAPELDIKTRWNSTYYMLDKWQKMEPAINMLAADNRIIQRKCPSNNDCQKIQVSFKKSIFL